VNSDKPLSMPELESLAAVLADKCLFEQAYAVALQVQLLQTLRDLLEQKRAALERDELEVAVAVKKQAAYTAQLLQPHSQEVKWIAYAAAADQQGSPIAEDIKVLRSIEPSIADMYATKYQALVTSPAQQQKQENFLARMRSHVAARRSFRMVAATRTTHDMRPVQWLAMLKKLYVKMMEGQYTITKFKALNLPDQLVVKSHVKMQDYIRCLVAVCEVACWVAASCNESMVNMSQAVDSFATAQKLLSSVQKTFEVENNSLLGMSLEDMAVEAGKPWSSSESERNTVQCELLLRPLFVTAVEDCKDDSEEKSEKDFYRSILKIGNHSYMAPAAKLYLEEISDTLPGEEGGQ